MVDSQSTPKNNQSNSSSPQVYGLIESMNTGLVLFDTKPEINIINTALKKIIDVPNSQSVSLSQLIYTLNQLVRKALGTKAEDGDLQMIGETGKGMWEKISFFQAIETVLQEGKTVRYPEVHLKEKYFELNIIPVYSQDQEIVAGAIIFHDITERVEVDRMKTEFVSVASHQLRTPLTSMRLFIEMLLAKQVGELTQTQQEYIQNLQESTLRMIKLVNEFLNVSRLENGRLKIDPQITNLKEFIQDVVNKLQVLGDKRHVKLEFLYPEKELVDIPIDQTLMHEVIKNLITNAISYSPEGTGKVTVRLESKESPPGIEGETAQTVDTEFVHYQRPSEKTLAAFFPQMYYLISVEDNGMGIPPEVQPDIFKKFFRADNAIKARSEGSGLGLYLVKMIVESSKGKIWFHSELGKGTTFYLALPLYGMLPKQGEKSLAIS